MATWRRDSRLTGSQRLLCAGLAGVLSLSLTAPLELATVLAQVGGARERARGPWAAGLRVWRAEGPRALWKGNGVACLRLFPCSALQLAAYRKFVMLFTDDLGYISQGSSIMAGSLAGMVSTILTYPTDLIKTRLIVQNMLEPSYKGIFHAFSTIYQQEGFRALYRGVSLTVLGALPFSAGSFLVYMNLENIWNGPRDRFSVLQNFANMCLAATVTQTLSFPFDTVKRKMQAREWRGPECLSSALWRSRCPLFRSSGLFPAGSEDARGAGTMEWIGSQLAEDSSILWSYVRHL
ncbi:PREDICTED: solute carrier family 25 member 43 isoform X2 [Condylura cristata]|uniref:solute carrier family 25 member 43 isoform X2 n=1 Tax=Condylura cristata TaxID=143302 RepID=UPI000642CCFD|nr:PREDICTED: solute carrier family 25 member 43 isoform X2 [Condylura cristata]